MLARVKSSVVENGSIGGQAWARGGAGGGVDEGVHGLKGVGDAGALVLAAPTFL
jgi:hypothetical protein